MVHSHLLARPDEPVIEREDDRRGAVAQLELAEDAADVRLHGALTDDQLLGNLRVRSPASDEAQHLKLALRQLV